MRRNHRNCWKHLVQLIQLLDALGCLHRIGIVEEKRFSNPFSDFPDLKNRIADVEDAVICIKIDNNPHAARRMPRQRN